MHEEHVEAFAQRLFKKAWDNATQEQRDKATPADIENYLERQRKWARETVAIIMDKAVLYSKLRSGRFHPSNKDSRWLFTQVTGITLPKGSGATEKAIREYVGQDVIDQVEKARADLEAKKAAELSARKQADELAWLTHAVRSVRSDVPISGGDLLALCRKLNVDVPLRTQGYMLEKLVSISSCQARHVCKRVTRKTPDMFQYYRSVVKRLNSVPVLA